ncbi:MAG: HD domain-containing protein [Desulfobacteraceae bacterium]
MTMQIDIRQLVHSLSDTLDLVGIDEVQHGKRVAFMAWNMGQAMNFSRDLLTKVYHASLLHDCGVSSSTVHKNLVTELDWEQSEEHCVRGKELLSRCRLFQTLASIIRYHHTHWEDIPDHVDDETALISNMIYLTDRVDALIFQQGNSDILMAREEILETIETYRGTFFKPSLVETLKHVADSELFWLSLDSRHLDRYISDMEKETTQLFLDNASVLEVAALFADIVDAKSPFTVEHSRGVARLSKFLGTLLELPGDTLVKLEVAGLLHDIGKLNVPDEILEKPGPLTSEERAVVLRHSFESYQILNAIEGFKEIAEWAAFHHEDLTGTGYPFHKAPAELSVESRIIAVADVFQALVQNRPYRDSLPPKTVKSIMTDMARNGKLDETLVRLSQSHFDHCLEHAEKT